MKKIVSLWVVVALCLASLVAFTGCGVDRSEVLKLYSQGEYMDEEIFEEFEEYYYEQTGKNITVTMEDFDSNEDMYNLISKDKADYDLICPSDYMIEKMIANDLVQKVDKTVIDVEDKLQQNYLAMAQTFDPNLDYVVPYMYGTYGIMYNYSLTDNTHISSIESLYNTDYSGEKTTKKSVRDTYTASLIYAHKDELSALDNTSSSYKEKLQEIFDDTTDANIELAKAAMTQQKSVLAKYDDEDGKFDMATDDLTLGLFWSCDAGYVMNDYEDEEGEDGEGNKNLWYVVPDEGGNVYIDGFVINKYAANVDAANMFLAFLCREDIAIANSEYVGAISTMESAYDTLYAEYSEMNFTDEDSLFYGANQAWKDMYMEMVFPSEETLNRCAMFTYYDETQEAKIIEMAIDIFNS